MATITKTTIKETNDEVLARVNERVEAYNKSLAHINRPKDWDCKFIVWTSGMKSNFYTLYLYVQTGARWIDGHHGGKDGGLITHYRYRQNLSTDFETAVNKALDLVSDTQIPICIHCCDNIIYEYNHDKDVIHFGKYNGQRVQDVMDIDRNYIFWLRDYLTDRKNKHPRTFNQSNQNTLDCVNDVIQFFIKEVTKKNEMNSKSEYVGNVGDKVIEMSAKVYKVFFVCYDGFVQCERIMFTDSNENIFVFDNYPNTKTFNKECDEKGNYIHSLNVGDEVVIKRANISAQYDKLGIKYNRVNRVKYEKVA